MRTTLTLDDDVAALLTREVERRKTTLKAVVNQALRQGLEAQYFAGPREVFRTRTVDLGAPRIEIDDVWGVIASAERSHGVRAKG